MRWPEAREASKMQEASLMIKAHITSGWLRDYIQKWGGALHIATHLVIAG
jgi:hypothetical protein